MKWFKRIILFIVTVLVTILANYAYVDYQTKGRIYTSLSDLPHKRAALLLGTNKYIKRGHKNWFYLYRIRAAAALWKAGKVDAIVVSGDNGTRYYDETKAMYHDLIRAGVPARYVTRDYAGFRTLDSVVRAGVDFGLEDFIIVSQPFHLSRALYIAQAKGFKAIGYTAKDIKHTAAATRMFVREVAARVKMMLDLYVLHTEPKYWGGELKVRYRR